MWRRDLTLLVAALSFTGCYLSHRLERDERRDAGRDALVDATGDAACGLGRIVVDVRSDYLPGEEAVSAGLEIDGFDFTRRRLRRRDPLAEGVRIAGIDCRSPGEHQVRVTLYGTDDEVLGRGTILVSLDLGEEVFVTVIITRDG